MDEKPYNEPAFPNIGAISDHQFNGMTLRDYFAAKVMQAMIANEMMMKYSDKVIDATNCTRGEWVANQAYRFADAMLKERAK